MAEPIATRTISCPHCGTDISALALDRAARRASDAQVARLRERIAALPVSRVCSDYRAEVLRILGDSDDD